MNREEATQWLEQIKNFLIYGGDEKYDARRKEALDMAIQALEQEPCEDAVSREDVKNAMYNLCDEQGTLAENPWRDNQHIDAITDAIDDLPYVKPIRKRGKWGGKCGYRTCSECGYSGMVTDDEGKWIPEFFCPNCGCQMEEGE